MKIGIMGGTFNPVHLAHLRIAEEVRDRLSLDKVIFIPAAAPPHKPLAGDLPFQHRIAMVRLAVGEHPCFEVSDMEWVRGGKSYSIDTIRALRTQFPSDEFFFIVGSDSFLEIGSWREFAAIFSQCNVVVVERPGAVIESLEAALPVAIASEFCYYGPEKRLSHRSGYSIYYLPGVPLPISSSKVRELVGQGHSVRYLLPDVVTKYIKEHRLYTDAD